MTLASPTPEAVRAEAMAASRREDHAAACLAWERFRSLAPLSPDGFLGGISALRGMARYSEAASLAGLAAARFADNTDLMAERARLEEAQSHWADAAIVWRHLFERRPGDVAAILGLARALTACGRQAEAEAVVARSCEAYPHSIEILRARAEFVSRKRDWPLAEKLWEDLRRLKPDHAPAVLGLAEALIQQKRHGEAEAVIDAFHLAAGPQRSSSEMFARIAATRQDWDEAGRRWSAVMDRFGESALAWNGVAFAHWRRGDLAAAEAAAAAGVAAFPNSRVVLELHASIAASARDWPAAEQRWDRLRNAQPGYAEAWLNLARCQRYLGAFSKAAALLKEAGARFPGHAGLADFAIDLALAAQEWGEAARLMRDKLAASPQDRALRKNLFHANWRAPLCQ